MAMGQPMAQRPWSTGPLFLWSWVFGAVDLVIGLTYRYLPVRLLLLLERPAISVPRTGITISVIPFAVLLILDVALAFAAGLLTARGTRSMLYGTLAGAFV